MPVPQRLLHRLPGLLRALQDSPQGLLAPYLPFVSNNNCTLAGAGDIFFSAQVVRRLAQGIAFGTARFSVYPLNLLVLTSAGRSSLVIPVQIDMQDPKVVLFTCVHLAMKV